MKRYSSCNKLLQLCLALFALFLPAFAYAHPGMHLMHDWLDGVLHILTKADHLAIIIAAVAFIFYIRSVRRKKN